MERSFEPEILDGDDIDAITIERAHRDLFRTHRLLGNLRFLTRALRDNALPVRRVLDVGCGHGAVLLELQRRLGFEAVGVDLKPPAAAAAPFSIFRADAVRDPLPEA